MCRAIATLCLLMLVVSASAAAAPPMGRTTLLYGDGASTAFAVDLQPWVDNSYVPTVTGVVNVHRATLPG